MGLRHLKLVPYFLSRNIICREEAFLGGTGTSVNVQGYCKTVIARNRIQVTYSTPYSFCSEKNGEFINVMLGQKAMFNVPLFDMNVEDEQNQLEVGEDINWVAQDETLMVVDSGEDDWSCLHDITLNGQILEYNGQGASILDVGLAQAKQPLNTTSHYFEIEILDPGKNCFIAIGLTEKDYPKNRLPGWDKGSIAYHADDGKVFVGCGVGEKFGPKCHKGDTMGCGISFPVPLSQKRKSCNAPVDDLRQNHEMINDEQDDDTGGSGFVEVFFTKNGTMVGVRRVMLPFGGFLPSVGMLSFHEKVKVNLKPLTG